MKRLMMGVSAFALLSAGILAIPAAQASESHMAGDADKGRVIFNEGVGDVAACASCHGASGLGTDDMGTPRLAYQVQKYVLKQLEDFAADKRMDNVMFAMNDVAKGLTAEQRRDVAAYVYSLKTPFMGSDLDQLRADGEDVGEAYLGQVIVEYGLPDHGVPACMSCHAFHGRAAGNMYPAISAQRYKYLKHELEAFRLGAQDPSDEMGRSNDSYAQMRKVAANMTDEDIANAAAFLTGAKPITPGNPRAPKH